MGRRCPRRRRQADLQGPPTRRTCRPPPRLKNPRQTRKPPHRRRGIIHRERGLYNLDCQSITDYNRTDLVKYLCAAIGRTWHTRDDAIKATARYLGFRRTGKVIKETLKSTINAAIRRKEIERDGAKLVRKAN